MRIKQVRDDIKEAAGHLLIEYGFAAGKDGRFQKTNEKGSSFSILFLEEKDRSSFSISLNISANYIELDKLFPRDETDPEFTLNCRLGSESIDFDTYSKSRLADIIESLTVSLAFPFLSRISTEEKVIKNLLSENSQEWITSDVVARYKFKFASAITRSDNEMISAYLNEADKALSKPWADQYKLKLTKLCEHARQSM